MLKASQIALAIIALSCPAFAHDPSQPFAAFYNALKQPGTGISCCDTHDCAEVEHRVGTEGYEALTGNGWVKIPDDKVLRGEANPTGRGVLCMEPVAQRVLCFVAASES